MTNSLSSTAVAVRSPRADRGAPPQRARHRAGPQRPAYRPTPWGGPELVTIIPPTSGVVAVRPIALPPAVRPPAPALPVRVVVSDPVFVDGSGRRHRVVRALGVLVAAVSLSYVVLVGCGALAGSPVPSGPRATGSTEPAAESSPSPTVLRSLP